MFFLNYFIICYHVIFIIVIITYFIAFFFIHCSSFIISSPPFLPGPKQSVRHPLPEAPAFLNPLPPRLQALMRSEMEGQVTSAEWLRAGKGEAIQWLAGR